MALTPTQLTEDQFVATFGNLEGTNDELAEAKTYKYDFNTGRFLGLIDEKDALLQFIQKALITQRDYYSIYSQDYGSEIGDLIGDDVTRPYLESEIPRMIREALEIDDRVISVDSVNIDSIIGDSIYISLKVTSVYGEIETAVNYVV